jgi:ribosomal-protein-alanine N-acetyltransferase
VLQMSRNYYRKPMVMALKNAILHLFPMIARRRRWQTPVLETARLVLRQINPTDFEDVRAWFPGAPDAAANAQTHLDYFAREYREHVIGPWGMQFKKTGVLVGNCGFPDLSLRKRRGEVNYFVAPQLRGQGLAPEALIELLRFGFWGFGLVRIQARCELNNVSSERVMQKVGMKSEGLVDRSQPLDGAAPKQKLYAMLAKDFDLTYGRQIRAYYPPLISASS